MDIEDFFDRKIPRIVMISLPSATSAIQNHAKENHDSITDLGDAILQHLKDQDIGTGTIVLTTALASWINASRERVSGDPDAKNFVTLNVLAMVRMLVQLTLKAD